MPLTLTEICDIFKYILDPLEDDLNLEFREFNDISFIENLSKYITKFYDTEDLNEIYRIILAQMKYWGSERNDTFFDESGSMSIFEAKVLEGFKKYLDYQEKIKLEKRVKRAKELFKTFYGLQTQDFKDIPLYLVVKIINQETGLKWSPTLLI